METENVAIGDYLLRLERAAQSLPAGRRVELVAEIRAHIDEARRSGAVDGEAGVHALLERLGPPEEIVAAEGGAVPHPPARRESTALEIWAALMLTVGSILLPVVGWLIGAVLLWSSRRWRTGEKLLGTLVVPGGLGSFVILGLSGIGGSVEECFSSSSAAGPTTGTCSDAGSSGLGDVLVPALFVIGALAALIVPFYLLHAVRSRRDQTPG